MATGETERNEAPTPRRREEARRQGQVAFSPDLAGSVVLLAGILGLINLGPGIGRGLLRLIRLGLSVSCGPVFGQEETRQRLLTLYTEAVGLVAPFMGLLVVAGV